MKKPTQTVQELWAKVSPLQITQGTSTKLSIRKKTVILVCYDIKVGVPVIPQS